jgi:glycosyltransferase involved in cell wall biosynthesis
VLDRGARIGLNALFLDPAASGGPETYLRGLVPALAREFPRLELRLATTRRGAAALREDGWDDFLELAALPCDEGQTLRRSLAEQAILPRLARREGWDLLHSLASVAPLRTPVPSVVTLHDVTFMKHRTFRALTSAGMRYIVTRAAHRADGLIAVSEAARNEICEVLGLEQELFSVVPHGAGRPREPGTLDEAELRRRHRLPAGRLVLCVAAKRPHKNQELLVRALAELPGDVAVVCTGRDEGYGARLRGLATELGVSGRLRLLEYVPDGELETLWSVAACAAFPTLAEGFGFPVIEAMQRAVPVACSDIPVLHEVGAELPHYFDPRDPRAAAAAIELALTDGRPASDWRARAAHFTWKAAAHGTLQAYERALEKRRSPT